MYQSPFIAPRDVLIFVSMRRLLILFIFLSSALEIQAQDKLNPNEYVEEKPVLMRQEATGGLSIHSAGWGVQFRRSRNITVAKKRMYEADFVGIKHSKEVKTVNQAFERARSYVYGKLNTFSVLRAGTGMQHVLFSKAERSGVEVRLVYSGGLSLGILKPVYLNILEPTGTFGEFRVITERYDPERHFVDNIYERAPYTEGLGEVRFRPGAYAKIGFNFEYAPAFDDVKAIEIGAIVDAYPKEIPIMAFAKNNPVFLTFYVTFIYGRKW